MLQGEGGLPVLLQGEGGLPVLLQGEGLNEKPHLPTLVVYLNQTNQRHC
jgi:hypothetical protein